MRGPAGTRLVHRSNHQPTGDRPMSNKKKIQNDAANTDGRLLLKKQQISSADLDGAVGGNAVSRVVSGVASKWASRAASAAASAEVSGTSALVSGPASGIASGYASKKAGDKVSDAVGGWLKHHNPF